MKDEARIKEAVAALRRLRDEMRTVRDYPARLTAGKRREMFDLFISRVDTAVRMLGEDGQ